MPSPKVIFYLPYLLPLTPLFGSQIGFLGPAVFLTQLGRVHTANAAVLCMMASQGLDAFSQSGLYSNHQVSCHDLLTTCPALAPVAPVRPVLKPIW